jgi:hypothetical protein
MANRKIKIGDTVTTNKGCRISKKKAKGKVIGFTTWRQYEAVKIKKHNGKIVIILLQNIVFIK